MPDTTQVEFRTLLARQQMLNQRHHKRLARKIHDEISQKMTMLALQLSLASTKGGAPENWEKNCKEWSEVVMELGQSIREITGELQPRIQDESGLVPAFRWLSHSSAKVITCNVAEPKTNIFAPPFVANELFAVSREIVSDILVPAKVKVVEVALEQNESTLSITLHSENPVITEEALDTVALHERLLTFDGAAKLRNSPETGSVLTLSAPVDRSAARGSR